MQATVCESPRYARCPDVQVHVLDDEAVAYAPAADTTHYLNRTALCILTGCDGRHTVEQIADRVARNIDVNTAADARTRIRDDVRATLHTLHRQGLVADSRAPEPSAP